MKKSVGLVSLKKESVGSVLDYSVHSMYYVGHLLFNSDIFSFTKFQSVTMLMDN